MTPQLYSMDAYEGFLEQELMPWLREQEGERLRVFGRCARRAAGPVVGAFGLLMLLVTFPKPLLVLISVLAIPGLLIWAVFLFAPSLFWEDRFLKAFYASIFGYFGLELVDPPPIGVLDDFYILALPPNGKAYEMCAHARGEIGGIPCDIALARHASSHRLPGGGSGSTGSLFVRLFSYPKPFSGVTTIIPDRGSALNFVRARPYVENASVERARLENTEFESLFEVYSTDQVEARYLLTPRFMERIMDVQRQLGRELRLAFGLGKLHLQLESDVPYFTGETVVDDRRVLSGLYAIGADIMRLGDTVETLKLDAETRV